MLRIRCLVVLALLMVPSSLVWPAEPVPQLPPGVRLEEQPADAKLTKIVFVAGSSYFKPGEHEYIGGAAVLMDLVRQTPGVFPVLTVDWPTKPETFAGARAIVFFLDGGDKHALLKGDRLKEIQRLADSGVGIVQLHQVADYPKDLGDRARALAGAAWEKGHSLRAHWVTRFEAFPDHPICRGVESFTVDDGWLWKLRFVPKMKGVTPLLRTVNPKTKDDPKSDDAIVSWAFERPEGGRAFTFTGGHLHRSFAEAGYRRFLVNGILWCANREIPKEGAPVALAAASLERYLAKPPVKK